MFFKVDPYNGVPVYEQVVRQITFAIAGGALRPGEMLPSVRQLAMELAINPNTVARAYRALSDDQIVETIRGTGMQVAHAAVAKCQSDRKAIIFDRLEQVIREARQSQMDDEQIRGMVEKLLAGKHPVHSKTRSD